MSEVVWSFRSPVGPYRKGDVQAVGERVMALAPLEPDGQIGASADQIVDDSRSPDSPLHPFITHDKDKASYKWNIHEAQRLICNLDYRIIEEGREPIIISPAFVRIKQAGEKASYVSSRVAMSDEESRLQVLDSAQSLVYAVQERLRRLNGLTPEIIETVDHLLTLIDREKVRKGPAKSKHRKVLAT